MARRLLAFAGLRRVVIASREPGERPGSSGEIGRLAKPSGFNRRVSSGQVENMVVKLKSSGGWIMLLITGAAATAAGQPRSAKVRTTSTVISERLAVYEV
jgi:hypothetical protein